MSGYSIPHRLALLATSPVATGEAKIEAPPQGDGNDSCRTPERILSFKFKNQNPARGRSVPPASPIEMVVMNMYERPSKIAVHFVLP